MTEREKKITLWVFGGIAVLFLAALGSVGFWDPDEGRYAAIPAAMLHRGDWIVPHLDGLPYLEKPPLLYWMTALSFKALGLTEFAGRLPMAICGFVAILAIYLLGRRRLGWRTGILAAAILAVSPEFFGLARFLMTDMPVACCLTLAMVWFYLAASADEDGGEPAAIARARRRDYLLFFFFLAMATLSKGLIGFLLPAAIIGAYVLLGRQWRVLREIPWLTGIPLFAVLVVPWFALVQARHPQFLDYFIVTQHFRRFSGGGAEHHMPFWFFVPVLLAGFFPWSLALPWAARSAGAAPANRARAAAAEPERRLHLFLWLWAGIIFVFFSISSGKLPTYILPVYPPLALLAAQVWARALGEKAEWGPRRSALLAGAGLLLFGAALLAGSQLLGKKGHLPFPGVTTVALAFAIAALAGGAAVLATRRRPRALFGALCVANILLFAATLAGAKIAEPYLNLKPVGLAVAQRLQPGDELVLYHVPQPSLEFYAGRAPAMLGDLGELVFPASLAPDPQRYVADPVQADALLDRLWRSGRTVYCVLRPRDLPALQRRLPLTIVMQNTERVVVSNR